MSGGFLDRCEERADLNQYWYSKATIESLVAEVEASSCGGPVAFLSTPSIFFSLPEGRVLDNSYLLDIDPQWARHPRFVQYDYRFPEQNIPCELHGAVSMVVIDPPFISAEVWQQYCATARLLLKPNGRILATTVAENAELLRAQLGVAQCAFKPVIPHLVYQYDLFSNYEAPMLSDENPELANDA